MIVVPVIALALLSVSSGPSGMAMRDLDPPSGTVQEALREGSYPWYDSRADRVRPVWPIRISWLKWLTRRVNSFFDRIGKFLDRLKFGGGDGIALAGGSIGTVMLLIALVAFLVFIAVLWFRLEGAAAGSASMRARLGAAARLGALPEGIRPGDGDPWAEALKRRGGGRPDWGDRVLVCLSTARSRSIGVDPPRTRPYGPPLSARAPRPRFHRLDGRDVAPLRGCLLWAEVAVGAGV